MSDVNALRDAIGRAIDDQVGKLHSEKIDQVLAAIAAAGFALVPVPLGATMRKVEREALRPLGRIRPLANFGMAGMTLPRDRTPEGGR